MFFTDELQYAECDAHYYDLHLKNGREILLSRSNTEEIHSAYAEYVFSQLSERDGASPDRTKRS
jgi:hypothetical protein